MFSRRILLPIFLTALVIGVPSVAQAQNFQPPSVTITERSYSLCGTQQVPITGTVTPGYRLSVTLNGSPVNITITSGNWASTALQTVNPGTHTVVAEIAFGNNGSSEIIRDEKQFTIAECGTGGPGDEKDCCPGPDPVLPTETVRTPRVLGATTSSGLSPRLAPLNNIFRLVCDRDPTFEEWEYWANRLLDGNMAYDELLGAIQWQVAHGRSIGL